MSDMAVRSNTASKTRHKAIIVEICWEYVIEHSTARVHTLAGHAKPALSRNVRTGLWATKDSQSHILCAARATEASMNPDMGMYMC